MIFPTESCDQISSSYPIPEILNNVGEFKDLVFKDEGSLETLISHLNTAYSQNIDSTDLNGKIVVIKAYVTNLNNTAP